MSIINQDKITRPNNSNSSGGTLIDQIYTSVPLNAQFDIVKYVTSDHHAVIAALDISITRPKDYFKFTRKFSEDSWKIFLDLLTKEGWRQVYEISDMDQKSERFMDKIVEYFNFSFPLKKKCYKSKSKK